MVENYVDIKQKLYNKKKKINLFIILFSIVLIFIILFSVSLGRADLSFTTVCKVVVSKIIRCDKLLTGIEEYKIAIVWDIRIPRIIIGTLVGAGLSVAGVVFQSILKNPLADPYTIGVSTGASFGAVLAIYLNLFIVVNIIPIMPMAFIGAIVTLYIVVQIAKKDGHIYSSNLILAGIIVSSILSAGISLLKSLSGEEVSSIIYWLMGNLSSKTWFELLISFPVILICIILCSHYASDLDIMTLGENEARSLGVDSKRTMKLYLIIASLIIAICVSVSGIIGFIGLVVPHILRQSISTKNTVLIPLSALVGAIILVTADNISRTIFNVEIPVGVITTLLGGPFFVYIFMRRDIECRLKY